MATAVEPISMGGQQLTDTGAAESTPVHSKPNSNNNRTSTDSSSSVHSYSGGGTKLGEDEIEISFLLQTSEKAKRVLKLTDTALVAKENLLKDWPAQFGPQPSSAQELKFLYNGRFFENSQTLSSVNRFSGYPTVLHLIVNYNRTSPKEGGSFIGWIS
ncbi:hypothetical protein EV177_004317 [Coemansia sp. RSA 1804]|nr:hypothetical protein EV177_004317 [Coemansia sp. RSA 1804]